MIIGCVPPSKVFKPTTPVEGAGESLGSAELCAQVVWNFPSYNPDWDNPGLAWSGPIVATSGMRVSSKKFGPQPGQHAIVVPRGVSGVVIEDSFFSGDGGGYGILLEGDNSNIEIKNNYFYRVRSDTAYPVLGVQSGKGNVSIHHNRFFNTQGTVGQYSNVVQFRNSEGWSLKVINNRFLHVPGRSWTADFINLYNSSGTIDSRIEISGNKLVGGSNGHIYGDGIVIGDGEQQSRFVSVGHNTLINAGLKGITNWGTNHSWVFGNSTYFCGSRELGEWGPYRAGQLNNGFPDKKSCHDNALWGNRSNSRSVGNYGVPLNTLVDFEHGPNECSNTDLQSSNNWQDASLGLSIISNDFMNYCSKDVHCSKGMKCNIHDNKCKSL